MQKSNDMKLSKLLKEVRFNEQTISEAPMDSRFQKEWEKNCKALLNHIDHELKEDAKTGRKNYRELTKLRTAVIEASAVPSRLAAMVGMQEVKINEGTKAFEPGDMWSNDFDYIGMLKYGAQTTIPNLDQLNINGGEHLGLAEDLQELFDSFEDVNYHRESQDLGNAIEWLEDAKTPEDITKAQEFLKRFRKKCAATLDVMKVKWTPNR